MLLQPITTDRSFTECREENLEKIKTAMMEAVRRAKTDALRTLLDPDTLEDRIEEILFCST